MLLLAHDDDAGGGQMTDTQVRDEALTLFLAGHETTANALTWTWYLLSQNPECERRLHEEIDTVLEGRVPGWDDLAQLRYTEMIFAEALRLYPPAWAIGRMPKTAFELGGAQIPADSILIMSPYMVQRDARWFPRTRSSLIPSAGRRRLATRAPSSPIFHLAVALAICIGERFAWMEGVIVHGDAGPEVAAAPGPAASDVEPLPLITLRTRHGMRMRCRALEADSRAAR